MPGAARETVYTCKDEFDKQIKEHEEAEAARKLQMEAVSFGLHCVFLQN
jgi:hypothetical protein